MAGSLVQQIVILGLVVFAILSKPASLTAAAPTQPKTLLN
jgi:hypothetical protein